MALFETPFKLDQVSSSTPEYCLFFPGAEKFDKLPSSQCWYEDLISQLARNWWDLSGRCPFSIREMTGCGQTGGGNVS